MSETAMVAGPETKPRRWWAAVLLMILGGVGYLYVGRPRRYALYIAVSALLTGSLYHGLWGWLSDPVGYWAVAAAGLFFGLGVLIDVVRLSVTQKQYVLKWYNRWWIYPACFVALVIFASAPELISGPVSPAARGYSIPAASMAPTVLVGDTVIADTRAYGRSDPQRGDIVIFRLPSDPSIDYIKRVIGLPGDRVRMVGGVVHINGTPVPRERGG